MTPAAEAPAERRTRSRRCSETGCRREAEPRYAMCARCLRAALSQAFGA